MNELRLQINIFGDKNALIEGCDSIADISDEEIIFNCGKFKIHFLGDRLQIVNMKDKTAYLEGKIKSVKYN